MRKKRSLTAEHKEKIRLGNIGKHCRPMSENTKAKLRMANLGKTRRKLYPGDTQRDVYLRKTYGITEAEYKIMSQAQDHKCSICGQPETRTNKGSVCNLAVDHCHTTGKVRGLLCNRCNSVLGRIKESVELLQAAIVYLQKYT